MHDTYSRWLRLLVAQAINELARSAAKPPRTVLFLLDEFAALGRMQPVERFFADIIHMLNECLLERAWGPLKQAAA